MGRGSGQGQGAVSAQRSFDAAASRAGSFAESHGHVDAANVFLNQQRHQISMAERQNQYNIASVNMNNFLRGAQKAGATFKGRVYRGTTAAELDQIRATGRNSTTWSVSKDPEGAAHFAKKGGVLLKFNKNSGTVPVDNIRGSVTYNEGLIPRGTSVRITKEYTRNGVRIVTLERDE